MGTQPGDSYTESPFTPGYYFPGDPVYFPPTSYPGEPGNPYDEPPIGIPDPGYDPGFPPDPPDDYMPF